LIEKNPKSCEFSTNSYDLRKFGPEIPTDVFKTIIDQNNDPDRSRAFFRGAGELAKVYSAMQTPETIRAFNNRADNSFRQANAVLNSRGVQELLRNRAG
jgi:hypothetical protein